MRAIFLAAILLAGCHAAMTPGVRAPDEFTGCGSDEQYRLFDSYEPTEIVDDSLSPQVTQPAANASVPFANKVILQWNESVALAGKSDGDVIYMDGPGCMACCPQFNLGSLTTLHLPPISGDEYDLQFTVDGSYTWRVVTTLQEWTPPDDLWASWQGKSISMRIFRIVILQNNFKEGPYVASKPFVFSVGN